MSVSLRWRSLRRVQVVLALALIGWVFVPTASSAATVDTVTATGGGGDYSNVNITAQSGTTGQSPSGTVSFTVAHQFTVSGPVTCLSVTGPDRGGGTPSAPTTAVLNFLGGGFGVVTVELVDNGGGGADIISSLPTSRAPSDCSPFSAVLVPLTNGRAVVFDAPVLPTSADQCKNGGWRSFGVFKNQGDCVSFVATGGKNQPG